MRILFLNLPYKFKISRASRWPEKTKSGTLYYPYWLCYAAGVCLEKGHEVDVVDCITKEYTVQQTIDVVKSYKPDYIVAEITTSTCFEDYEVIHQIKAAYREAKIIIGGTHATALPEKVLMECADVDIFASN